MTIREMVAEMNEDALFADGFDDAIIGVVQDALGNTVALYDTVKILSILEERDGMSEEEAEEFFKFNILGSYMGEDTPMFATIFRRDINGN